MGFKIVQRNQGDVRILDLKGALTVKQGTETLREVVQQCLLEDCNKLILNLTEIDFIDGAGWGCMVQYKKEIIRKGGGIRIVGPMKYEVLSPIGQAFMGEVFLDESEAVASYSTIPPPKENE
jgi:anti-anti-sigma factor